jgi:anti-sigma factor RsiW
VTCQDAIAILADYLEAALAPEDAAALEAHLADCPACIAYLNTYRKTTALAREAGRLEMPAEMRERLRRFLVARLGGA